MVIDTMHYYDSLDPQSCTGEDLDFFLSIGWYPMGQSIFTTSHLYKKDDKNPPRVHWLRYSIEDISERKSHRRIRRKNSDLSVRIMESFEHNPSIDDLYQRYFSSIDFPGYPNVENATYHANGENIYTSKAILISKEDRLLACGIYHIGSKALCSILHFFDPDFKKRSLGKYLILLTLDYCRENRISYYYPGYIIEGNPKMDYKLFLGKESAKYYVPEPNPLQGHWAPYHRGAE